VKQSDDRYLKQLRARYNRATKKEKTAILDEYVKTTGQNRSYASGLLSGRRRTGQRPICRPRRAVYGDEDWQALLTLSAYSTASVPDGSGPPWMWNCPAWFSPGLFR